MDRKWWTLIAVSFGVFMLLLDITVVNVALPDIQRSLHSSFSDLQWVVDAYSLTLAAFLLTSGSLADLFGRRLIFATGLVVFTCASALCGLSTTPRNAQPRPRRAGRRRGDDVRHLAGADRQRLPRARPRHGLRGLRRRQRGGRRRGPGGGRGHHLGDRLGMDLLRQRPDRHRRGVRDAHQGGRVARPERDGRRLGRAGHLLGRPLPARVRARPGQHQGLGLDRDRLDARRGRRAAGRCSWSSSWPSGARCSTSRCSAARPSRAPTSSPSAWRPPTSRCSCT